MKALDAVFVNCGDEVSMQVRMVVVQFWEGDNAVFVWARTVVHGIDCEEMLAQRLASGVGNIVPCCGYQDRVVF